MITLCHWKCWCVCVLVLYDNVMSLEVLVCVCGGSWFRKKHPRVMTEYVHLPPLPDSGGDVLRSMSVIPYLDDMFHTDEDAVDDDVYDTRDADEINEHVIAITEGMSAAAAPAAAVCSISHLMTLFTTTGVAIAINIPIGSIANTFFSIALLLYFWYWYCQYLYSI